MRSGSQTASWIYTFPALAVTSALAYGWVFFIHPAYPIPRFAPGLLAGLDALISLQLILAWQVKEGRFSIARLYLLLVLLLIRLTFWLFPGSFGFWGFRAGLVMNPWLGLLVYGPGAAGLHPSAYEGYLRACGFVEKRSTVIKCLLLAGWLMLSAVAFWSLPSTHITRDGFDWIQRTTQPVWHLYVREPLTIGLYRLVFLIAWPWWEMTSYRVIATLSVLAGMWWASWYGVFLREKALDAAGRGLAWLLAVSSGGMAVLFFGHIEVYPIFLAGMMPVFYFAQRYLNGRGGLLPVAVCFSIAFLLHLSAGWLLPAFLILPFCREKAEKPFGEAAQFWGVFAAAMVLFWGSLVYFCYDGGVLQLLARIHEDFNTGPDRAMFLPSWLWFHRARLLELLNSYVYLSVPALILIPITLAALPAGFKKETIFWAMLAGGYLLYSFFFNPDRRFPEDWDLFSGLVLFTILLQVHAMLAPGKDKAAALEHRQSLVYLASMGALGYAAAQVWYHHTVPFIPPTLY
ncbi:MAG: hypothetical protein ACE15F_22830 [bacterium]